LLCPGQILLFDFGEWLRDHTEVARTINRVADENNLVLSATPATLSKWLNGATPKPEVRAAALEAFRRLAPRQELTASDLGWPGTPVSDDPWQGDPVAWLERLGRDDMNRRTALYTLAAAAIPAALQPAPNRAATAGRRAGRSEVERIQATTKVFGDLDDQYGGGHARSAAAAYLTHEVVPLLHGSSGRARPSLFVAAAELAYLLGWMAADDLQPGLSQRYYIQAIRLADEAGNRLMRSMALRSLAVQAVELGHGLQAVELAEAAQDGLRGGAPARTRAWVTGMCAEAVAASRFDRHRAYRLLSVAEADLERADSAPEAELIGGYRRESYEHQVGLTLSQIGDHAGAAEHYALSASSRRPIERRTKALVIARLADAQLRQRLPEAAARTVLGAAGELPGISSARVHSHFAALRAAWQPYRTDAKVAQADRLLASLV